MNTRLMSSIIGLMAFTVLAAPSPANAEDLFWGPTVTWEGDGKIIAKMQYGADPNGHFGSVQVDTDSGHMNLVSTGSIDLYSEFIQLASTNFLFVDSGAFTYCHCLYKEFRSLSDQRVKKDIRDFSAGLRELEKLQPVRFKYNGKAALAPNDGVEYIGLIAQDLREVLPFMVSESQSDSIDGHPVLTVDSSALTYVLINSVKEEAHAITKLGRRLDEIAAVLCARQPGSKACKRTR